MLPLTWGNLTNINLEFVALSVLDIAYLLPQFTRAEYLGFATDGSIGFSMPAISRVRLPQLTEISWVGLDMDGVSIFDRLILPHLFSLEMREGCQEILYCLRQHASFPLRELTLVFFHIAIPRFSAFLREMPSLISLELRMSIHTTDDFLAFLTYNKQRNLVLPNLERLALCDREQHFSESVMLRMLESRWRKTPFTGGWISTRRTEAHASTPAVHRKVMGRLIELVEEGLKFKYDF
jgi:hypothetical protein